MKKEERKGKRVLGYLFYYSIITDSSSVPGHASGAGTPHSELFQYMKPNWGHGVFICVIPGQHF